MKAEPKSKGKIANYLAVVMILVILLGVALGPRGSNSHMAMKSAYMQTSRAIGLVLYQYSLDHNGHYPEGKTSTEVFQQLMDGQYITDPSVFYATMRGKIRSQSNQLKSENVCWDVTCCVDSSAPNGLPVVFMTGYKITYVPGASAVPINQSPRTWAEWWNGPEFTKTFIAVFYYSNSAMVKRADEDGSIPNFIPADFDPKGKTYRQLTP